MVQACSINQAQLSSMVSSIIDTGIAITSNQCNLKQNQYFCFSAQYNPKKTSAETMHKSVQPKKKLKKIQSIISYICETISPYVSHDAVISAHFPPLWNSFHSHTHSKFTIHTSHKAFSASLKTIPTQCKFQYKYRYALVRHFLKNMLIKQISQTLKHFTKTYRKSINMIEFKRISWPFTLRLTDFN